MACACVKCNPSRIIHNMRNSAAREISFGGLKIYRIAVTVVCLFLMGSFAFPADDALSASAPSGDYVIGPQDVLEVIVWDNQDLSEKVAVSLDGYINYHLIGKVKAAGLSTGELAQKITELLSAGYVVNPQVNVRVVEYLSQKVFMIGEVAKPGTYYLTKQMTIVEALSMAGGLTKDADTEATIVRPGAGSGGAQPKVDIRSALEGDLSQNIRLENGDSVFVPKAKTFFIMGEVNRPGEYKLESGTTVRRAISLSGGETDKGSIGRAKVIRKTNDKEAESRIGLDDVLQPGDTIVIPERFF